MASELDELKKRFAYLLVWILLGKGGGGGVVGVDLIVVTGNSISILPATEGDAGSMSASDKAILDFLAANAATNASDPLVLGGGNISINPATEADAGSLSASDKTKIDHLVTLLAVPVGQFLASTGTAETATPTVDFAQAWPPGGAVTTEFTLVLACISVTPANPTDNVQVVLQRDDGPTLIGPNFTFTGPGGATIAWIDTLRPFGAGSGYRIKATNLSGNALSFADGQVSLSIADFGLIAP